MSAARDRVRRLRRAMARLSPLVSMRRRTLVALILASAGAGLVEALVLSLIAYIAATMSTGGDGHPFAFGPLELSVPISFLLGMAASLAAVRLVLQLALARLPARLSGSVQSRLRAQLMGSFLASTWAERSKEREGHLQELMAGQSAQAGGAVLMLAAGVAAALEFTMLVVSALVLSVGVSIIVILTALTLFSVLRPLSKRVRRRSAQTSAASIDQAAGVAEAVHLSEELEVFGVSEAERLRLLALTESLERHFVRTRTLSRIVPVLYQSAVILLLVAGLSVLHMVGTTRLAALGAVVLLLVRASAYGQQVQAAYQGVGEALPYIDRVTAAIQRYQANVRRAGVNAIESIQRAECANISFEYRPGSAVLRDVNCSIEKGEAVGIVGPSAAGKSTLLQLMLGLRHPTRGAFLVNGMPMDELDEDAWRRKVSFLPQEPHLLWGTVADNIRFQRPWVDDEAIVEAARRSHIHDEIMSWQDQYQTVVGQTADAVSGGQRQRLCLARALAGRPEMLLLDEPTSSLDPRSEELIRASLADLKGRVTLIVVAHRLTTLSLCDRVMVIRGGVLEAFAPTDLLYASNDFYRQSVDLAAAGGA